MKKVALLTVSVFVLSGCVRTYSLTRDRIDQDLTAGNRGYIQGQAPFVDESNRKTTRTTQIVEIELRSPLKLKKEKSATPSTDISEISHNQQYQTREDFKEVSEENNSNFQSYTVGKNDTLQKISKKFYGTTKKWKRIYNANQNTLRGPDKLYVGQVLRIPLDGTNIPNSKLK